MPRWGRFEFDELRKLGSNLKELERALPGFIEECVREIAGRLLAKVVPRTPVDTGELRRRWTIGQIRKTPDGYEVEVINPVEYSLYREYGHRTANHMGWVEGSFMLTISNQELERELPALMEKRLEKFLKKFLG
ncbi:HK97 gp10 family phage protein [Cohnella algarum]|uniref:HK97 gp10 family phage protein n=1 Tax=Cohnella algarum TaxID=2044859 RepID=UPI0019689EFC|nr:HK97 gp10 family phage protein [Cohnella algarum]MBN2980118.1 HK97 gp10 family phage protein [Cohnella algarum]